MVLQWADLQTLGGASEERISPDPELDAERKASLVIRSLKAKFPLSDKFLSELFKAIRIGADLRSICKEEKVKKLFTLDEPTAVKVVRCCINYQTTVVDRCQQ